MPSNSASVTTATSRIRPLSLKPSFLLLTPESLTSPPVLAPSAAAAAVGADVPSHIQPSPVMAGGDGEEAAAAAAAPTSKARDRAPEAVLLKRR